MKFGFLFFTLLCVLAFASDQALSREFDVRQVVKVGRSLSDVHLFSIEANALLSKRRNRYDESSIDFWLVYKSRRSAVLAGISTMEGENRVILEVRKRDAAAASFKIPNRELKLQETARLAAYKFASNYPIESCEGKKRYFVLESPDSDNLLVYLLIESADADRIQIGGHVRFTFSADGKSLLSADPLSIGCDSRELTPDFLSGKRVGGLKILSYVGEVPLETHVYLANRYDIKLRVGTLANKQIWKISETRVRSVDSE